MLYWTCVEKINKPKKKKKARICWLTLLKAFILNFHTTWPRKAKLNLGWSAFVKINVLSRKYIYYMPPETPSMFLNFIRIFNDPQPNTDTLKESECQKALGILKTEFKGFQK